MDGRTPKLYLLFLGKLQLSESSGIKVFDWRNYCVQEAIYKWFPLPIQNDFEGKQMLQIHWPKTLQVTSSLRLNESPGMNFLTQTSFVFRQVYKRCG